MLINADRTNNENRTTSRLHGNDNGITESAQPPRSWGRCSLTFAYSLICFSKSVGRSWNKRFPGWRSSIAGFSILAATVLVANVSTLIWAATHLDDGPFATLAVDSCKSIASSSSYLHGVINVLSAGLLAGSNYCMQCLSSPTRDEIDAAHSRDSYLNVGILSWRNVVSFRKRRIFLLSALIVSSVPLHSMYGLYSAAEMHLLTSPDTVPPCPRAVRCRFMISSLLLPHSLLAVHGLSVASYRTRMASGTTND